MITKEQYDAERAKLQTIANQLGEEYDTVQILTTRHESAEVGGTLAFDAGCGNWFARAGQIRDWIMREDTLTRLKIMQQMRLPQ